MSAWTYANIWESVAAAVPDQPAIVQGERVVSFAEFEAQADALAAHLLAAGLQQQAKVAVYATNCPEFLIAYYAAFKAGLAPFNVNYRYGPEEVRYLLDNGDAEAVVFEAGFAPILDPIRARDARREELDRDRPRRHDAPAWAEDFAALAAHVPADAPGRRALGPARRGPAADLHRRHHRHAQGGDVAAGRSDGEGRLRRQPAARHRPDGGARGSRPARRRRADQAALADRAAADARDRADRRVHRDRRRAARWCCCRTASSIPRKCGTRSSAGA